MAMNGETEKTASVFPVSWVGWRRRNESGARWKAVCEAPTEAEAFRQLLDRAATDGIKNGSMVVLRSGEKP